jgi:hypothetical protein
VNALRQIYKAWNQKPTAVTIPLFMLPIGIAALILGDDASRAFANLGGAVLIRIMGAAMVTGSTLVMVSLLRDDALVEVCGLAFAALGAAIYSAGVLLGLGTQGVVAGLGFLAITVAFLGRIRLLVHAADSIRGP